MRRQFSMRLWREVHHCLVANGKDPGRVFIFFFPLVHLDLYFVWVSLSGFSSSFLPKEESVTAAPEVEVSEDYQASSQVSFSF